MLPKISTATYEIEIPGVAEPIQYRPFTVKEFKALLQAKIMGDEGRVRKNG